MPYACNYIFCALVADARSVAKSYFVGTLDETAVASAIASTATASKSLNGVSLRDLSLNHFTHIIHLPNQYLSLYKYKDLQL